MICLTYYEGSPVQFIWHPDAKLITKNGVTTQKDLNSVVSPLKTATTIQRISVSNSTPKSFVEVFNGQSLGKCFYLCSNRDIDLNSIILKGSRDYQTWFKEPCFIVNSGGTEGSSKQILRTQRSWIESFNTNKILWPIASDETYGLLGDLHHSITLYGALEGLHLGKTIHFLKPYRPKTQLEIIERSQITLLYATPTQLWLLTRTFKNKRLKPVDSLKKIIVGGSKLTFILLKQLQEIFPSAKIIEFYGTTETSFISYQKHSTPENSAGEIYPRVQIHILDENKNPLPIGQVGQVSVQSPYLSLGTFTGKSFKLNDASVLTGELGHLDEQSILTICGRSDRMFLSADINIFPEEIETYFSCFPCILAAFVYPMCDDQRGNSVQACFFVNNNNIQLNQILSQCRKDLGPLKAPQTATILNKIPPILPSGKLDYKKVKEMIILSKK